MLTVPRSFRWLRDEFAFVLVVAATLAATLYLYVYPEHWRRGTAALGVVQVLAALLRVFLPAPRVGMLNVRGRLVDTLCYLALGVVILAVDLRLH